MVLRQRVQEECSDMDLPEMIGNKKNLITLLIVLILLIAIPLTFYLVKQRQIFKPKAAGPGTGITVVDQQNNPEPNVAPENIPQTTQDTVRVQIKYVP